MNKFSFKDLTLFPSRHPDKRDFSHIWFLAILPVYLISFFIAEAVVTDNYWVSFMAVDNLIPFCEWFIIPYCLWYPFMLSIGVYLLFCDAKGFRAFMSFIGLSFMCAVIIFLLFPNGQDLRPEVFERDNALTRIIASLYKSDTNTNVLPSLHVVGSLAVPFAAQNNKKLKKPLILILLYVIAFLISISTVFVKQHSLLDVIVAIPYSVVFYVLVYKIIFKNR